MPDVHTHTPTHPRARARPLSLTQIENGYGRVLARPGLSLRLRELCVLAILAGQVFFFFWWLGLADLGHTCLV